MDNEFKRMQKLAGVPSPKTEKTINENLKFHQVERGRKYFATTDFGIFKKGDELFADTVRNLGTEVVIELSNGKGKHDSIKGDLEDEVEVFGNTMKESLNENFVGMGMVGNIFDREKTDYENAFEHFMSGKYTINEEEGEEQDIVDAIVMDVPLFIRMLEYAREDASTDMDLHDVAEKAINLTKEEKVLTMKCYEDLVGGEAETEEEI